MFKICCRFLKVAISGLKLLLKLSSRLLVICIPSASMGVLMQDSPRGSVLARSVDMRNELKVEKELEQQLLDRKSDCSGFRLQESSSSGLVQLALPKLL